MSMNQPADRAPAPQRHREPVQFFDHPDTDMLMAMVVALAGEVAVLRDRLDTHERLGQEQAAISPPVVDEFRPDRTVTEERNVARLAFLRRVLAPASECANSGDAGRKHAGDRAAEFSVEEIVRQVNSGVMQ
jgi:hypothetical protein